MQNTRLHTPQAVGSEPWQTRATLRRPPSRGHAGPVQAIHGAQVLRLQRRRVQTRMVGHTQVIAEPH